MWHIGEILVRKHFLTWEQLEDALAEQKKTKEFIGEILVRKHYVSLPLLFKALAEQYNMKYVDLKRTRVNPKAVENVKKELAEKYELMPIEMHQSTLTIGISSPLHAVPESELKQSGNIQDIKTVLCLPEDIKNSLKEYYVSKATV